MFTLLILAVLFLFFDLLITTGGVLLKLAMGCMILLFVVGIVAMWFSNV
jgi:hypothetical protein